MVLMGLPGTHTQLTDLNQFSWSKEVSRLLHEKSFLKCESNWKQMCEIMFH